MVTKVRSRGQKYTIFWLSVFVTGRSLFTSACQKRHDRCDFTSESRRRPAGSRRLGVIGRDDCRLKGHAVPCRETTGAFHSSYRLGKEATCRNAFVVYLLRRGSSRAWVMRSRGITLWMLMQPGGRSAWHGIYSIDNEIVSSILMDYYIFLYRIDAWFKLR